MNRRLLAAFAALAVSACSSPAGTSFAPLQSPAVTRPMKGFAKAQRATLHLVFRIPRRRLHHRARYVSPATQSFVISAQAGSAITNAFVNATPSSSSCAQGLLELTCSLSMQLAPGSYTVTISAYDAQQSSTTGPPAGNLLSTNSVAVTIAVGKANTINATLDGVPKTITVAPSSGQTNAAGNDASGINVLGGASVKLLVAAYDADGYVIVGPGAPTVSLAAQNASGGIAVASATNGNPNAFTLSSTGLGAATLVATATPGQGSAVTKNVSVAAMATTTFVAGQVGTAGYATGTGNHAQFGIQNGLTYDPDDGNVYVADSVNCIVRKVTPAGVVTNIAGTAATCDSAGNDLDGPQGIAYDHDDGYLYVADTTNCTIDRMTTSGSSFARIAGTAGTCNAANLSSPWGIVYGGNGALFFTDAGNCQIRAIYNLDSSPVVSTIAGGSLDCTNFDTPRPLAFDGTNFYFWGAVHCDIRKVGMFGEVSVLAGQGFCLDFVDGTGTAAYLGTMWDITYDSNDGALYVSDNTNNAIRRITTAGVVTTVFGNPIASSYQEGTLTAPALTKSPWGITYASAVAGPGSLYIIDGNAVLRQVNL